MPNETNEDDDAFIRWQAALRAQLGNTISLILGLSSAALAYCASLLTQPNFKLGGNKTFVFIAAVAFFGAALFLSIASTFTRLCDTRITAKITRIRKRASSKNKLINCLKKRSKCLGNWTWSLTYIQTIFFLFGVIALFWLLWQIFHAQLFPLEKSLAPK